MRSQLFKIVERERDPQTVLETLAVLIAGGERNYPVEEAVKMHFNLTTESYGRNWGEHLGTIEDIRLQREALDPGFHVTFAYDEYARGCHMGTSRYNMFIPDNLVTLWEAWQDEDEGHAVEDTGASVNTFDELHNALLQYIKDRVASIREEIEEKIRADQVVFQASQASFEQKERDEFERLSKKFSDG